MRTITISLTIFFILLCNLVSAQPGVDSVFIRPSLASAYDATVLTAFPTVRDTAGPNILSARWTVSGTPNTWRNYFKFNLNALPPNATVLSAYISVYADTASGYGYLGTPTYGTANASVLERVTSAWTRSTISWNNQPTVTTTNSISLVQSTSTKQNYINLNATNMVLDWLAFGNNGFLLRHVQEVSYYNSMIFHSPRSLDSTKRPSLKIFFTLDTLVYISSPLTKTTLCAGDSLHVNYKVSKPFITGNNFTAQLSNGSGSFASPVNIGSLTSITDGKIICTVPSNMPLGTGYRIRVVASNPIDTSADNGINITISPQLVISSVTNNGALCEFDTLKLDVTSNLSGMQYNWSGPASYTATGQNVIRNNAITAWSGVYTVIGNLNGCKDTGTTTVVIKPTPSITALSNGPLCVGDSLKLEAFSVTPGLNYSWTGPGGYSDNGQSVIRSAVSTSMGGTYIAKADLNGCFDTAHLQVQIGPVPVVSAGYNGPLCEGDTLKIQANGATIGINYSWTGPGGYLGNGQNITRTATTTIMGGVYTVTADTNGCTDTANVNVVIKPKPAVSIISNSPLCEGDTLSLMANINPPTATITWSGPGGFSGSSSTTSIYNVTGAASGTYNILVNLNGCIGFALTHVSVTDVDFDFNPDTTLCKGQEFRLQPGVAGGNYLWQDSSTADHFIVNKPGKYYVTISKNSCTASDTMDVKLIDLSFDLGPDTALCPGSALKLSVTDTFDTYKWSTNDTTSSIIVKGSGDYKLTIRKAYCTATDYIKISYLRTDLSLGDDRVACRGEKIMLNAISTIPGSNYLWQDAKNTDAYIATESGLHWVNVTNQCGVFADSVLITFEECDCNPFVPSGFTPNGDGLNDKIGPIISCQTSLYQFLIVNRWGEVVFQSTSEQEKWNGNYKGQSAVAGTYFYYLKMIGPRNKNYMMKGDITLIR